MRELGKAATRLLGPTLSLWALMAAAGCLAKPTAKSEETIKSEFTTYVNGANQCRDASDCTVATADCPLGCYVPVRTDRKVDVERRARELITSYAVGGGACYYDCAPPDDLICVGRCTFGHAAHTGSGGTNAGGMSGAGGSAGAGGAGSSSGGPVRTAFVALHPIDGTTATGDADISAVFSDPGSLLTADLLDQQRAAIVLTTWPEQTPVTTSVTLMGVGGPAGATLRVAPASPLGDRWYMLRMTNVPSAIVPEAPLQDGTVGVRFRATSQPRVLNLRFCEKEGAGSKLLIAFSEPVTYVAPTSGLIALSILGVAAVCDVYDAMPDTLGLTCPQLTATSNAHIDVGTGIQGATGVPLPPLSVTVDVGKLSLNGGCRTYTREIP